MKKYRVIILGAGNRGNRYATHMSEHPELYEIVGMADPQKARQEHFQQAYGVPKEGCYNSWEEILAQPKMADICVITTSDHMHHAPALKAIELGYHLLLEKPVAQTAQQCADIARAAKEKGVTVLVCHVLRYTPFYGRVKELLLSGIIGDVISVDTVEGVGNAHFAHAYVRGRWNREADSTPMLLAKSCHDLDIIQWLLDKPCKYVQSFGSLTHFCAENAPEGAPARCVDGGCPVGDTCPYNCIKEYVDNKENHRRSRITVGYAKNYEPTDEEVLDALRHEEHGLCVYRVKNDVVDHQTVNMEFAGGVTATLNVNAFNKGGRYLRIYGTKGELFAFMKSQEINIYTFEDKQSWTVPVLKEGERIHGSHGGGDEGIVLELHAYLSGNYTGYRAADIQTSVRNHIIGFAAEESRHNKTVVNVEDAIQAYGL